MGFHHEFFEQYLMISWHLHWVIFLIVWQYPSGLQEILLQPLPELTAQERVVQVPVLLSRLFQAVS